MAVGQNGSTNPFDEPSEEEDTNNTATSSSAALHGNVPAPTNTIVFPFIRVPILLVCTTIVFVLLIAGTATTTLSFPPKRTLTTDGQNTTWDGDYKLLGPLLLTSGCFLLCVTIALCSLMVKEAYRSSKIMAMKPGSNAWNNNNNAIRPMPISLVGGPFFIATTDPAMTHPSFLSFDANRPNWVHPNAPMAPQTPDDGLDKRAIRPQTATISRGYQPPFNPDVGGPMLCT